MSEVRVSDDKLVDCADAITLKTYVHESRGVFGMGSVGYVERILCPAIDSKESALVS